MNCFWEMLILNDIFVILGKLQVCQVTNIILGYMSVLTNCNKLMMIFGGDRLVLVG